MIPNVLAPIAMHLDDINDHEMNVNSNNEAEEHVVTDTERGKAIKWYQDRVKSNKRNIFVRQDIIMSNINEPNIRTHSINSRHPGYIVTTYGQSPCIVLAGIENTYFIISVDFLSFS